MGVLYSLTCLLRNLYVGQEATVRTGHGTMNRFKTGKEVLWVVYCLPIYLIYVQNTSCKMPGWMNHKLESRLPGEISTISGYVDDTTLMAESEEELKSLLMKEKKETEKAGIKLNIQKN